MPSPSANTYSFLDVQAAIKGPNGSFPLGSGAGVAEEGITISYTDEKGSLIVGADGTGMHSLHAGRSGTVTVRLLKTSPTNALLMQMYNADTVSAANYGRSTILVRNPVTGDSWTCSYCGFRKVPDNVNAKDGGVHEWTWNVAYIEGILGTGTPAIV